MFSWIAPVLASCPVSMMIILWPLAVFLQFFCIYSTIFLNSYDFSLRVYNFHMLCGNMIFFFWWVFFTCRKAWSLFHIFSFLYGCRVYFFCAYSQWNDLDFSGLCWHSPHMYNGAREASQTSLFKWYLHPYWGSASGSAYLLRFPEINMFLYDFCFHNWVSPVFSPGTWVLFSIEMHLHFKGYLAGAS